MADFYLVTPPSTLAVSFNNAAIWANTPGGTGGAGIPGAGDNVFVNQDSACLLVDSDWTIDNLDMTGSANTALTNNRFHVEGTANFEISNVVTTGDGRIGHSGLLTVGTIVGEPFENHSAMSIVFSGGNIGGEIQADDGDITINGDVTLSSAIRLNGTSNTLILNANLEGGTFVFGTGAASRAVTGTGDRTGGITGFSVPIDATAHTGSFSGQLQPTSHAANDFNTGGDTTWAGSIRVVSGTFAPTQNWTQTGGFLRTDAAGTLDTVTNGVTFNVDDPSFILINGTVNGPVNIDNPGAEEEIFGDGTHGDYTLSGGLFRIQTQAEHTGGNWTVAAGSTLRLQSLDLTLDSLVVEPGGDVTENDGTITTTGNMTADGIALSGTTLNIGGTSAFTNTTFENVDASGSAAEVEALPAPGNSNVNADTDPLSGLSPSNPNVLFLASTFYTAVGVVDPNGPWEGVTVDGVNALRLR